jgi:hypothetical protein
MSWMQRLYGEEPKLTQHRQKLTTGSPEVKNFTATPYEISLGLTRQYDRELREKAGMREPPVLPENMGLEGEYDEQGLAKRVAQAFDQTIELQAIETVTIAQDGSTIVFSGQVPDPGALEKMVKVASVVDGTRTVDYEKVKINQPD